MERIGVRDLRQNASRWFRRVEDGETFEVSDRGRPVAVLAPTPSGDTHIGRLVRAGELRVPTVVQPSSRRTRLTKGLTASQTLAELRSEDRG